jgi:5-methylcytosine-specific restriction endonuclease McrA
MANAARRRRYRPVPPVDRTCSICSAGFLGRPNATVCSTKCRNRRNTLIAKRTGVKKRAKQAYLAKRRDQARETGEPVQPWTPARQAADIRRRARKAGARVEKFTHVEIFERDGWRCALCGGRVDQQLAWPDPMSKSLDHIVPLSAGGDHVRANVQLAHLTCNVRKSAGYIETGEQLMLIG